jgi:hypothetical protein
VSGSRSTSRRKRIGILLLVLVSLAGAGRTEPARHFLGSAHQFVRYYRALEETSLRASFWDRVALSLVLATSECPKVPRAKVTSS